MISSLLEFNFQKIHTLIHRCYKTPNRKVNNNKHKHILKDFLETEWLSIVPRDILHKFQLGKSNNFVRWSRPTFYVLIPKVCEREFIKQKGSKYNMILVECLG